MRILYLITKSEEGGAQTHVSQLCKYFNAKGDSVAVMSYPGGWLEKEVEKIGVQFYANHFFSNNLNPIKLISAVLKINNLVKEFKPDLICCHSSVAGFLGRMAVRNKIPTIFTSHGWGFNDYTPFLFRMAATVAEKIAAVYCVKIICVSEFVKKLAIDYKIAKVDKLIVVYNGIEQVTKEKKFLSSSIKIIFVGRLANPKEPEALIKAYLDLPENLKNKSEILIIGDGHKRKSLEALSMGNNKIKFCGSLPRDKTLEILKEADIFVLTSKWESFGLTALEAMNFGLPVIVSDVGGLKEVVDKYCGIFVEAGNVEEIKQALNKLLTHTQLVIQMGSAAKKRAELFRVEKMLEATENVYKSVI